MADLNNFNNKLDLIDTDKIYIPFKLTWTKTDHILKHKSHLKNFKEWKSYRAYS